MIEAISLSPIQYKWVYHIETTLKYLRAMVGNKARVEDASSKLFFAKEGFILYECVFHRGTHCLCSYDVIQCQ
jgi:hypothetical protein